MEFQLRLTEFSAGMTEDERRMLDQMRAREQALKQELDVQEGQMRAQQQLLREQEAERSHLAAEFEAMQVQVHASTSIIYPPPLPPAGKFQAMQAQAHASKSTVYTPLRDQPCNRLFPQLQLHGQPAFNICMVSPALQGTPPSSDHAKRQPRGTLRGVCTVTPPPLPPMTKQRGA